MKTETNLVMCCFCNEGLTFENAVQLSVFVPPSLDEQQTIFCHKKCLDKLMHKSVNRHPDLLDDNESNSINYDS